MQRKFIGLVFALVVLAASSTSAWTGPTAAPPNGNVSAPVNVGTTDQVKSAALGVNALAVFGNTILSGASRYLNWGTTSGPNGYGIRDIGGTLEFKNSGGSWASLQSTISALVGGGSQWTTSGNNIYSSNSGNVGIGTASPAAKLDVYGDIFSDGSNAWLFHTPDDGRTSLYFGRGANGSVAEWPFEFKSGGNASFSGKFSAAGEVVSTGNQVAACGGGACSHLRWPGNWSNYLRGNTYFNGYLYDENNTAYYLDPSGTSNVNNFCLNGTCKTAWPTATAEADTLDSVTARGATANRGIQAYRFTDDDSNYYIDANTTSYVNDFRPNIIYDRQDGNYQVDPNGTTALNYAEIKNGSEPTINFHRPNLYATGIKLRSDNRLWFGGWSTGEGTAGIVAGAFTDGNNGAYFVDPNGSSQFASVNANGTAHFTGYGTDSWFPYTNGTNYIRGNVQFSGILYDESNNAYYLDPSGTSALNTVYANSFLYSSDRRLKENIVPLFGSLSKVGQLAGVSFVWKPGTPKAGKKDIGVIAQDVEKVLPEAVHTDEAGMKSVDYAKLVPLLINAINEQQSQIDELKAEVNALKK